MIYWAGTESSYQRPEFHHEEFAGFRFCEDRLDSVFFEVLNGENAYEDLWNALKFSRH